MVQVTNFNRPKYDQHELKVYLPKHFNFEPKSKLRSVVVAIFLQHSLDICTLFVKFYFFLFTP